MNHCVGDRLRDHQQYPVTILGRTAETVQPFSDCSRALLGARGSQSNLNRSASPVNAHLLPRR
jgi:hypothetical protein